jgi:taurine dioxygenase
MQLHPVSGYIGAEVDDIDLKSDLSEDAQEELRQALFKHLVLFFRDQHLSLAEQKRLTELFGPLNQVPYVEPLPDDPYVIAVLKEATETNVGVFGGEWHSDFSFLEHPPAGSVLNAVEVPLYGGDTMWANQEAAYDTLPERLREVVETGKAVHTGAPYGAKYPPANHERAGKSIRMTRGDPEADREIMKPIVRVHPETGRKALFVNPIYTTRIDGLSAEDSAATLRRIYRHCTRPDLTCRHRWRPGDIVVWDNRATLHYALNDYDGYRRLLYRTTFADRP